MKKSTYSLSSMAMKEWRDFALYTIAQRALPSMVDGLKPSQRFYLYSSIVSTPKDFARVDSVASDCAKYGYQHGDTGPTGQLMASTWANNLSIIEGQGSFGSRMVQKAAADRYTKTRLHKNFHHYVKDIPLAPEHDDPEHIPPAFYIPTIPLVLVNGARGIATGYATLILSRSVKDVKKACSEYIRKGKIAKPIPLTFPVYNGRVEMNEKGGYMIHGSFKRISKTKLIINEIPYGYDRETYIKILDKLEDDGKIVSYTDLCDKNGFCFDVKLKRDNKWSDTQVTKEFKLVKTVTENINVIGPSGKLTHYDDARELVGEFVDFRMGILEARIAHAMKECIIKGMAATLKMRFVKLVLDDKIEFRRRKKAAVVKDVMNLLTCSAEDADRLLRMNLLSFTTELVAELRAEIKTLKEEIGYWKATTPAEQFKDDLSKL